MADEKEAIIKVYKSYLQAFQTLDPRAVAPYYDLPCVAISAAGVSVMATAGDLEAYFGRTMERLRRKDYGRSEFTDLRMTTLHEDLVLLSAKAARYKANGDLMEWIGATYTWRKTEVGWKMVALTMQDPDAIANFRQ